MNDQKSTSTVPSLLRFVLIAILALNLIPSVGAQEKSEPSKPESPIASASTIKSAADPAKPPATEKSSGGPQEGIKIHGHWTIVVKNADGSVVSKNEFQNSLIPLTGPLFLVSILSRQSVPGLWSVGVNVSDASGNNTGMIYSETAGTLTTAVTGATFTMTGTTTSPQTGNLTSVSSNSASCPASTTAATCTTQGGALGFTAHRLAPFIPVQAGQTVDLTVSITFS